MLTLDQNKRPSAEQLLRDPWCKEELLENPDLSYLGHRRSPLPEMHPPPPPPSPISEFGEIMSLRTMTMTDVMFKLMGVMMVMDGDGW